MKCIKMFYYNDMLQQRSEWPIVGLWWMIGSSIGWWAWAGGPMAEAATVSAAAGAS